MFFPQNSTYTELASLRAAAAEIQRERDDYAAREQAVRAELEQTRQSLQTTLEEARQARDDHASREQALEADIEHTQQSLRTALEEARQARARITSMESSKFWKLRRIWFRLKRWVGLGMDE